MALSSSVTPSVALTAPLQLTYPLLPAIHAHSSSIPFCFPAKPSCKSDNYQLCTSTSPLKWRTRVSFLQSFLTKGKDTKTLKDELLETIAPLDRGANASPEDQQEVDQIARQLEVVNPTKEPLKSDLLNGKWELIYTTSRSILQTERPKFLRSSVNYQAINVDTLRAQNMESWPFFNQVTADLTPLNPRKVAVKFDYFKILGLIPIKAPERARFGELEITYLDDELRISRGDKGNLFILKMVDPSYRVPV
ncbi:probable plastid-lipid-associated protein 4, chloroplastic isoform X2 [Telopea speciosissima]|uniref:probable plastid-lipid-associated protein 4, chloroplastic isoform X1 n=1 Tax=Telopea speciosissima TaxID=54955 RepID=UPI001CC69F2D|nr:probable plastid-lipid-associated protein 4, chloroplastic isoform X1 [Telopea speciosissima]XP_043707148.1 probable plastid-lipid-associated protein 4, chloroplastic isoform X2 [Telopea speciosissima]